jgi:BirA family biotin operon repressor/biotin-[acetyl-CoA-carboxylase] ligase
VNPPIGPLLSLETIRARLSTRVIGSTLSVHREVDSTNRLAGDLAQAGTPDGTVIVAEAQTQGHGRLGRSWFSPPGMNLYLSILLARAHPQPLLTWIPLLAGVAVVRAIQEVTDLPTRLKWPNDVQADREGHSRKIAGILTETIGRTPQGDGAVVVGIGINVNMPHETFPEDLRPSASSLLIETGRPVDRIGLLARLLLEVEQRYEHLLEHGTAGLMAAYRELSDTLGRQVRVELVGGGLVEGSAEALAPDGALRLRTDNGTVVEIRAGDVVHLR